MAKKIVKKKVIEVKKKQPNLVVVKSMGSRTQGFGGGTIYPNSEGYWPTMPFPLEEIPQFNFYEAFRRFIDVAAIFASQNADRISSANLILAVPEKSDWANETGVITRKHRKDNRLITKGIEYGTHDYVDILDYEHPVVKTLSRPNDLVLCGSDVINQIIFQLQFFGDCFVYKYWNKDRLCFVQLNPCEVALVQDTYSFAAPKLRVLGQTAVKIFGQNFKDMTILEPDRFIHFKLPAPNRWYYGMGFVEIAWRDCLLAQEKTRQSPKNCN